MNSEAYYKNKIDHFLKCKSSKVSIQIYETKEDFNVSDDGLITKMFWLKHNGGAYFLNSKIHISKFKKLYPIEGIFEIPYKNSEFISILAHEYGHFLSVLNKHWNEDFHIAYARFNGSHNKQREKFLFLILEEEDRAWNLGKEFLHQIDCKIPKCFDHIRKKSISAYNE